MGRAFRWTSRLAPGAARYGPRGCLYDGSHPGGGFALGSGPEPAGVPRGKLGVEPMVAPPNVGFPLASNDVPGAIGGALACERPTSCVRASRAKSLAGEVLITAWNRT